MAMHKSQVSQLEQTTVWNLNNHCYYTTTICKLCILSRVSGRIFKKSQRESGAQIRCLESGLTCLDATVLLRTAFTFSVCNIHPFKSKRLASGN